LYNILKTVDIEKKSEIISTTLVVVPEARQQANKLFSAPHSVAKVAENFPRLQNPEQSLNKHSQRSVISKDPSNYQRVKLLHLLYRSLFIIH